MARVSIRVVALVASDERSRADLTCYLEQSGFDVRLFGRRPRRRDGMRSLIWLADRDGEHDEVADRIGTWLSADGARCAVVVTSRPAAFRALRVLHGRRLCVLPAPVFGWEVVDALARIRGGGTA
jgi:hypothetical protein